MRYTSSRPNRSFAIRFRGTTELYVPRRALSVSVPELNDGLFRLATWQDAKGNADVWVWLATYSADPEQVRAFGDGAREALRRLFPGA